MEAVYSAVESEGAKPRGSIGVEGEDMTLFFGVDMFRLRIVLRPAAETRHNGKDAIQKTVEEG
jgi:hypothetical protein